MTDHNTEVMSESEEMYLITVARLVEQGTEEPVSISQLAGELSIQPVSANQMVHKLAEEGLIDYYPYQGVQLTKTGQETALRVLRDRRLWETFLVNYLEMPPTEADALACRLEHITPEGVTGRLAEFLGNPSFSPQGFPIPGLEDDNGLRPLQPLSELGVDERGEIIRLEVDPATQAYLESEGFRPGTEVIPLAVSGDGAMLVQVGDERLHLSSIVTKKILVGGKTSRQ